MVSPAVYAKLLNCLDDTDKKITNELNRTDVEETPMLRPSEQQIQNIQNEELNFTPPDQQQDVIGAIQMDESVPEQQQPAEITEAEEIVENFEQQGDKEIPVNENIIEPVPNILRSPCPNKTTDMRGDVPPRNIPCENKKTMLIVPSIMKRNPTAVCKICQKTFSTGYNLRHHISIAHTKTFYCNICEKNFANQTILSSHNKRIHPDSATISNEENRMMLTNEDLEKLNDNDVSMENNTGFTNWNNLKGPNTRSRKNTIKPILKTTTTKKTNKIEQNMKKLKAPKTTIKKQSKDVINKYKKLSTSKVNQVKINRTKRKKPKNYPVDEEKIVKKNKKFETWM